MTDDQIDIVALAFQWQAACSVRQFSFATTTFRQCSRIKWTAEQEFLTLQRDARFCLSNGLQCSCLLLRGLFKWMWAFASQTASCIHIEFMWNPNIDRRQIRYLENTKKWRKNDKKKVKIKNTSKKIKMVRQTEAAMKKALVLATANSSILNVKLSHRNRVVFFFCWVSIHFELAVLFSPVFSVLSLSTHFSPEHLLSVVLVYGGIAALALAVLIVRRHSLMTWPFRRNKDIRSIMAPIQILSFTGIEQYRPDPNRVLNKKSAQISKRTSGKRINYQTAYLMGNHVCRQIDKPRSAARSISNNTKSYGLAENTRIQCKNSTTTCT